jgi:hypothetical protein
VLEVESVSKEVIKRLGLHIASKITGLNVLYEFPEANVQLAYPSLSIIQMGDAAYTPENNIYEISRSEIYEDNTADIRYCVGKYDIKLQLDAWCRSKEERNDLYQSLFLSLNSEFPKLGLSLNLTDYYNIVSRYNMVSFIKDDTEIASQRKEWRVKINVMVDTNAVIEKQESIMVTLESHTEIPQGIQEINTI